MVYFVCVSLWRLHVPDLDVDLTVDSLEHPERYPRVSEARPNIGLQRPGRTARLVRSRVARQAVCRWRVVMPLPVALSRTCVSF
jgi:hypothetical protein